MFAVFFRIFARFCLCRIPRHGDSEKMDRRLQGMFRGLKLNQCVNSGIVCVQLLKKLSSSCNKVNEANRLGASCLNQYYPCINVLQFVNKMCLQCLLHVWNKLLSSSNEVDEANRLTTSCFNKLLSSARNKLMTTSS